MDRSREYSWSDPFALAEAGRDRAGLDFLTALLRGELPPPPIAVTLGFEIAEVEAGRVVFTATPGEHLYNPIGVVHGGVAATLLDTVTGCAVHTMLPAGTAYTSLDLSVKYLRPLTADTGPVRAIGHVINKGRRTALAEGELRDAADRLLAHGTSSCMIFPANA
ncbi:MAG TPA: PaaI family thioesterase [Pseudonocardiaceae bacterium]|nr:PaaI family thioesterase [Pseudonocardiaceae bacterium]